MANRSFLFKWVLLLLAILGIVILFFVFRKANSEGKCSSVEVSISHYECLFVDPSELETYLLNREELLGQPIAFIDLKKVENILQNHIYVQQAEAYIGVNRTLHCDVKLEQAVVRVQGPSSSPYYLTSSGKRIPWTDKNTADVPVVLEDVDTSMHRILYKFMNHVESLKQYPDIIQQIFVVSDTEIGFVTSLSHHKIVLGDLENLEGKMEKLFTFYKKGLGKKGWDVHKEIDLRYAGQVICR
jgi:cell division protein FtsQ